VKVEILSFALSLAEAAESVITPMFRNCAVQWKPDGSEVTDADRRAEEIMRELIAKHRPDDGVLGEEHGGALGPTNEPLWVLDPIDGTASFAIGLPTFGTLIGYVENGEPQVGVIHLPAMGETIYAARGSGCWARLAGCDATQVRVSTVTSLSDAYVSGSLSGSDLDSRVSVPRFRLSGVLSRSRRFRFIDGPVQYALLAQGRIDVAMDGRMKPWDIAALVPCIEEAGGSVSDFEGQRQKIVWGDNFLASCSERVHREVLQQFGACG
jgi:histidinol-phosphatase